jgi:hypothetical protein
MRRFLHFAWVVSVGACIGVAVMLLVSVVRQSPPPPAKAQWNGSTYEIPGIAVTCLAGCVCHWAGNEIIDECSDGQKCADRPIVRWERRAVGGQP